MKIRNLPPRLVTGAYLVNSGRTKLDAPDEAAKGLHATACAVYPIFKELPPPVFLKLLAIAELTLGVALLTPFIPAGLAGAGLTAFSSLLLGVYMRTPGMRKEASIWPTPQGIALSKDMWLLAIGLGLMLDHTSKVE